MSKETNYTIKQSVARDSRNNLNNLCFTALHSMKSHLNAHEEVEQADDFKLSQLCELYISSKSARDFLATKMDSPTDEELNIKEKNNLKGIVVSEEELDMFRGIVKLIDEITATLDGNNVSLLKH